MIISKKKLFRKLGRTHQPAMEWFPHWLRSHLGLLNNWTHNLPVGKKAIQVIFSNLWGFFNMIMVHCVIALRATFNLGMSGTLKEFPRNFLSKRRRCRVSWPVSLHFWWNFLPRKLFPPYCMMTRRLKRL